MDTYAYSYRTDSSNEPIGRVQATGLFEARRKIAYLKQLDVDYVDSLFKIKNKKD
jgi:hypothetical protein